MGRFGIQILGICASLFLAGCRSTEIGRGSFDIRSPQPPPNVTPQKEAKPAESDIKIVYVPARAKRVLAEPAFPESAHPTVTRNEILVTLTVDESGRVSNVQRSFADLSLPSGDTDPFMAAIIAATSSWEFEPARQVFWQKVAGADDRYLYAETVPARFDVRFVFARSKAFLDGKARGQ